MERFRAINGVPLLGRPKDRIAVISFLVEGQHPKNTGTLPDERGIAVRAGKLAAEPLLWLFGVEKIVRVPLMLCN